MLTMQRGVRSALARCTMPASMKHRTALVTQRVFASDAPATDAKPAATSSPAAPSLSPLRGHKDAFPDTTRVYRHIERTFLRRLDQFGYGQEVRLPTLEASGVFAATLGVDSEVVEKQMYSFDDHGTSTVLRPEGTASCMRAVLKRGVPRPPGAEPYPDRFYYTQPMFRRERPQQGRLREFTQLGVESVGAGDVLEDAQVVAMARAALDDLGLGAARVELRLNSLGEPEERAAFERALEQYLAPYAPLLSADSQRRLAARAPLRVLDSKAAEDQALVRGPQRAADAGVEGVPQQWLGDAPARPDALAPDAVWPPPGAPALPAFLGPASSARHAQLCAALDALGVAFTRDDALIRGLGYYSHAAFEFVVRDGAMRGSAVLSGGRYDGLGARFLPPRKAHTSPPAVGWAAGLERLALQLQHHGLVPPPPAAARVCVIAMRDAPAAGAADNNCCPIGLASLKLAAALRAAGVATSFNPSRAWRQQLSAAGTEDRARFAVVLGENELAAGQVVVRDLETRSQETVSIDAAVDHLQARIADLGLV